MFMKHQSKTLIIKFKEATQVVLMTESKHKVPSVGTCSNELTVTSINCNNGHIVNGSNCSTYLFRPFQLSVRCQLANIIKYPSIHVVRSQFRFLMGCQVNGEMCDQKELQGSFRKWLKTHNAKPSFQESYQASEDQKTKGTWQNED